MNVPKYFTRDDTRKASALPAFVTRPIDDINQPPEPFKEPLVSVTFDDGWESNYSVAAPILQRTGIHSTQYLLSGTAKDTNYMSSEQIKSMHAAGHEVDCHTVDHQDLTTLDAVKLQYELSECQTHFSKTYGVVDDFASPFGHSNPATIAAIKQVYRSHRNTNGDITNGINEADVNLASNFDRYNIIAVTIRRDTPVEAIHQAVDYTIAHNGWLILTYHQIDQDSSNFGLTAESLERQLAFLSREDVRIVTVGQVLDALNIKGR